MAKVSIIQREIKRQKLVSKYYKKRLHLKSIISSAKSSVDQKLTAQIQLQKLPVNSSPSRLQSRCQITGKPHSVYKKFGLCRNEFRKFAVKGDIPGLKKASW